MQERYLDCLCATPAQTAFTDVYQAFLLKRGGGADRLGGTAIDEDSAPIANRAGWPEVTIESLPDDATLLSWAVEHFGDRVRADLLMADPSETVISLGNVALGALRRLLGSDAVAPGETLQEIYDAGLYGTPGTLRIGDRDVEWFALAHPGLLKGKRDLPRATRRWHEAHDNWGRMMRARCGDAPRDETMHGA